MNEIYGAIVHVQSGFVCKEPLLMVAGYNLCIQHEKK